MDDQKIIDLYWSRNEQAIQASMDTYGSYCRSIALGILSDTSDAEEAVSDTWFHAWNAIPPTRPTHLKLFLGKLTRNLSISIWRKYHSQNRGQGEIPLVLEELDQCISTGPTPEDTISTRELAQSITAFLRKEPVIRRTVFLRRYFYLNSIAEIAGNLNLTQANVRVILSRTRLRLKSHLIKEGLLP